MAWVNANDFYNRSLMNDLVSLHALRQATLDLKTAKHRSHGIESDITQAVADIDAAITATEALLKGGSHHG